MLQQEKSNRSARESGFFRSKGRVTIAWPMKTFISRCYVRNASSGVVVPYTAICMCRLFIIPLSFTFEVLFFCFRIAVVTCMAGDALALIELWRRLIVNVVPIACGSMDKAF